MPPTIRKGQAPDTLQRAQFHERFMQPCQGCASAAMPLCHWPCSCYPNHSLRQLEGSGWGATPSTSMPGCTPRGVHRSLRKLTLG